MKLIVVLGDVMLDKYIYGEVKRISPEAPVPIINVEKEEYRLGGAANVANNIAHLGHSVYLIGRIGKNEKETEILKKLCDENNIEFFSIHDPSTYTITKTRVVALPYKQQLIRIDREIKNPLDESSYQLIVDKIKEINPEILVISDYNKGFLTKGLVDLIKEHYRGKILVDTKPSNALWYKGVYVFKPNLKEASEILGYKIKNVDDEVAKAGLKLVDLLKSNVVVTRSEEGSTLITLDGKIRHYKSEAKEVFDVSGAGDTYLATLACCLNEGKSLEKSCELANKASSIVVSKFGTSYVSKEELIR